MKYIVDELGFYLGFGGEKTELQNGQKEVPFPPGHGFLKPKRVDNLWTEGATQEELEAYADMQRGERIKEAYEQRKEDGWKAYQEFRMQMVKDIYDSKLSKGQAFLIEDYLGVGYDRIAQQGDWETAYYKLSQIVLPEAHAYVKPYLDAAKVILGSYIQTNYRPM